MLNRIWEKICTGWKTFLKELTCNHQLETTDDGYSYRCTKCSYVKSGIPAP